MPSSGGGEGGHGLTASRSYLLSCVCMWRDATLGGGGGEGRTAKLTAHVVVRYLSISFIYYIYSRTNIAQKLPSRVICAHVLRGAKQQINMLHVIYYWLYVYFLKAIKFIARRKI